MTVSKFSCTPLIANTRRATSDAPSTKSDLLTFFRAWTAKPLQVASIIPSGDALSELITSEISPETGSVIELGPHGRLYPRLVGSRG